jgi:hypothetical protein
MLKSFSVLSVSKSFSVLGVNAIALFLIILNYGLLLE